MSASVSQPNITSPSIIPSSSAGGGLDSKLKNFAIAGVVILIIFVIIVLWKSLSGLFSSPLFTSLGNTLDTALNGVNSVLGIGVSAIGDVGALFDASTWTGGTKIVVPMCCNTFAADIIENSLLNEPAFCTPDCEKGSTDGTIAKKAPSCLHQDAGIDKEFRKVSYIQKTVTPPIQACDGSYVATIPATSTTIDTTQGCTGTSDPISKLNCNCCNQYTTEQLSQAYANGWTNFCKMCPQDNYGIPGRMTGTYDVVIQNQTAPQPPTSVVDDGKTVTATTGSLVFTSYWGIHGATIGLEGAVNDIALMGLISADEKVINWYKNSDYTQVYITWTRTSQPLLLDPSKRVSFNCPWKDTVSFAGTPSCVDLHLSAPIEGCDGILSGTIKGQGKCSADMTPPSKTWIYVLVFCLLFIISIILYFVLKKKKSS